MSRLKEYCYECGEKIIKAHRSPYFCAPCDRKRIERIDNQLRKMSAEMDIPYPGATDHDADGKGQEHAEES